MQSYNININQKILFIKKSFLCNGSNCSIQYWKNQKKEIIFMYERRIYVQSAGEK